MSVLIRICLLFLIAFIYIVTLPSYLLFFLTFIYVIYCLVFTLYIFVPSNGSYSVLDRLLCIPGFLGSLLYLFLGFVFLSVSDNPFNYTSVTACIVPVLFFATPASLFTRNELKLKRLRFIKVTIVSIWLIYCLFIGLKISSAPLLVKNCTGKEICPGRVEALETLVKYKRSLEGINLSGANLQGVNLSKGRLGEPYHAPPSYFTNADLTSANLSDSYLGDADFSGANMSHANLRGAYQSDANLTGANLYSAKLINVENLTSDQIKSACNWEKAVYKDNQEEQKTYIKQLKLDKDSDPEKPVDCSRRQ